MAVEGTGPWYLHTAGSFVSTSKRFNSTALGASDGTTRTASVGTSGAGDYCMQPLLSGSAKGTYSTTYQAKGWNFIILDIQGPAGTRRRVAAGTWTLVAAGGLPSGTFPIGGSVTVRANVFATTNAGVARYLGTLTGSTFTPTLTQANWSVSASMPEVVLAFDETIHCEVWYTCPNATVGSYVTSVVIGPSSAGNNAALTLPGTGLRYIYDQSYTGSAGTPAGALGRTPLKPVTGSAGTPAGALVRRVNKALSGAVTPAGALLNRANKPLTGSAGTPAGSLRRTAGKALAGSAGTPTGSLRWLVTKKLTGGITPSGTVTKLIFRTFTALVTSTGTLRKVPNKPLTGAVTPSPGTLVRSPVKSLTGSAGTPTGSLSWLVAKVLSGQLTSSGALTKLVSIHEAGTTSTAGALRNVPYKPFGGSLAPTGDMGRAVAKRLTGSLSPTATVQLLVSKHFTANITPTAVAVKFTLAKFFRGYLYGPAGDGSGGSGPTIIRRVLNVIMDD